MKRANFFCCLQLCDVKMVLSYALPTVFIQISHAH